MARLFQSHPLTVRTVMEGLVVAVGYLVATGAFGYSLGWLWGAADGC